jgi:hypothetical protein
MPGVVVGVPVPGVVVGIPVPGVVAGAVVGRGGIEPAVIGADPLRAPGPSGRAESPLAAVPDP